VIWTKEMLLERYEEYRRTHLMPESILCGNDKIDYITLKLFGAQEGWFALGDEVPSWVNYPPSPPHYPWWQKVRDWFSLGS
jgi:hypothetical protein